MPIDYQNPPLTVLLGDRLLTVSSFQLKTEVPVLRHMLCDGSLSQTLLPESPCRLVLSGSVRQQDAGELMHALHDALHSHTAFCFSFAGCSFSQMQIMDAGFDCNDRRITKWTITMTGVNDA